MKKTRILYWVFTGLFGAFMMFTAIPNILLTPESVAFITALGYPEYLIPFLGVAKALGVVGILVPGFPRLKEWAYAGLLFDLVGATYSIICQNGLQPDMVFMLPPYIVFALSYFYYHKKLAAEQA